MREGPKIRTRCLFIGIDGATDDVMGPMMDHGHLPNLARIRSLGAYGRLESQPGYSSPALWTTITSGYAPNEHGIQGFSNALRANVKRPRLHERLAGAGWRVGMCRMFCNWPPADNETFVIPSFADVTEGALPDWIVPLCKAKSLDGWPAKAAYMWHILRAPVGLSAALKILRAGFSARHANKEDHIAFFLLQRAQHWLYARLFRHLLQTYRPDYASILMGLTDAVGHRYWKYHCARKAGATDTDTRRLGGIVERAYVEIDRAIGEILELSDNRTVVAIASDHGMELVERRQDWVPASNLPAALGLPSHVECFFAGYEAYFAVPPHESLSRLMTRLLNTHIADTGKPLFDPCDIVADRIRVAFSRETPTDPNTEIQKLDGKKLRLREVARLEPRRSGDHGHGPDGVLFLKGHGVKPNSMITGATHYDVVPTILTLLGQPLAADFSGGVLEEILTEEVLDKLTYETRDKKRRTPGARALSEDEQRILEDRLRSLGYVD